MSSHEESAREKVFEMLHAFETAMMVTRAPSGPLDCRPMHIAALEKDGRLWFITSIESDAALHVKKDPEVLLVMQDEHRRYLSIFGRAAVVNDREQIRRLWKEPYRVWFPGGVDDLDVVLIGVTPDYAEFWDTTGVNKLRYLFEAAKAYATGTRPEIETGEQHGRTRL